MLSYHKPRSLRKKILACSFPISLCAVLLFGAVLMMMLFIGFESLHNNHYRQFMNGRSLLAGDEEKKPPKTVQPWGYSCVTGTDLCANTDHGRTSTCMVQGWGKSEFCTSNFAIPLGKKCYFDNECNSSGNHRNDRIDNSCSGLVSKTCQARWRITVALST